MITPKRNRSKKQTKKIIKTLKLKSKFIMLQIKNIKKNTKKYLNSQIKITTINNKIKELNIHQKNYYNKIERYVLSNRYLVEDNYKNIKKAERIVYRKDHKIKTYMSFVFINELRRLTVKYQNLILKNKYYDV
jgi:hypothetical protein